MTWIRNQKLTTEQIATIKHLKSSGIQLSLISQIIADTYGVSRSAAYYHCSDNRESYEYTARKIKNAELQRIKQKIHGMIEEGLTTADVASLWNMDLKKVNKIYIR